MKTNPSKIELLIRARAYIESRPITCGFSDEYMSLTRDMDRIIDHEIVAENNRKKIASIEEVLRSSHHDMEDKIIKIREALIS